MKLSDLFWELVIDVWDKKKGHIFYDQIIWSLAIETDHVRSNVAELTWQICDQTKWSLIRISPVQFDYLYGPSPIIQPIYLFIFYQFSSSTWASPNISAFLFLDHGLSAAHFVQPFFVLVFQKCTMFQSTTVWAVAFQEPKYYLVQYNSSF